MRAVYRSMLLIALTSITSPLVAADPVLWPGWLGPQRNGWIENYEEPAEWPETLTEVWRQEVGTGYGTPLVTVGHIIQHARQGENEVLWCFDRRTGEVVWRSEWQVPFRVAGGGELHGKGPKSSPVMADGRVFTMSITGELRAWSADTGKLLWTSNLGSNFSKSYPNWGASTSPVVDGSKVIVHFGTDDEGALTALDTATGSVIWSLKGDGASYSSPLLADISDVRQVIEWNHEALVGVDTATGTEMWRFPFPHVHHNQNMPTPVLYNGSILLGAENRGIRSVTPRLQDGRWSVTVDWEQNEVALDMATAVINKDRLYGLSHYGKGRIFCLNPHTGEIMWQGPGRTGSNATFLSFTGTIVALTSGGELRIIDASSDRYNLRRSFQAGDDWTWSPPVMLDNEIVVKDRKTLVVWKF